jgi:DNA/RNA endonuclease YhcR with UshA esterase domain
MDRSVLALSLALALATAVSAPGHAQLLAEADITPLSRARAAGAGANVLVDGVVSVPPGVFDGGFAIQDRTGGIWVMPLADPVLLRVGQRVRIRGTLDNPNNQLAIVPSVLQLFDFRGAPESLNLEVAPEPRPVRTGAVDEEEEGWLVRIRGTVVTEPEHDDPWGWKVMVDDGSGAVMVFLDSETDLRATVFTPGATVEVTGFAGQYDDHYEVVPRAQDDVVVPTPD